MEFSDSTKVQRANNVETFWINNSIKAQITPDTLNAVVARDDVVFVELERKADVSELMDAARSDRAAAAFAAHADASPAIAWSVTQIKAPLLWQLGITGSEVIVAVVDSGVNYSHPDLQNRMWSSSQFPRHGFDFDANDDDPIDSQGHGTCCAGIVAGDGSKGRATGVAPGAKIMAVRVGGASRNSGVVCSLR